MSHKVSVIVPVWNMARFLPDAIASIPKVHEIIIVAAEFDDGSFDAANELARRRPEIRVVAGSNQGPARERNIGLREASGDVIAFNDADDIGRKESSLCNWRAWMPSLGSRWSPASSPISTCSTAKA